MSINILPTNNRGSHSIDQFGIDQYGIKWNLNSNGFRTIEFKDVDFIQPRAMGAVATPWAMETILRIRGLRY